MKTVLVLGGYGFLATNLLKYIDAHLLDEYRCVVFDKFDHHPAGVSFSCVCRSYAGDFSDSTLLRRIFEENTIDLIIHSLSTTVPVDSSNARFDVESNLLPSLDVLSLMVEFHVQDIVYLSSGGAIYGTDRAHRHAESDDVFPVSSYGVVKLAIEKYMMQYAELYGIRPLIIRLSNPYGPYHYSMRQGVINIAIARALRGESMQIWGDGNGRKDYIYVEDFAEILFRLIRMDVRNEVVNVGSGATTSVNEIVESVSEMVPSFRADHVDQQRFDVSHFELDLTKLTGLLGELHLTSMQDGLLKTFNWTKSLCD